MMSSGQVPKQGGTPRGEWGQGRKRQSRAKNRAEPGGGGGREKKEIKRGREGEKRDQEERKMFVILKKS